MNRMHGVAGVAVAILIGLLALGPPVAGTRGGPVDPDGAPVVSGEASGAIVIHDARIFDGTRIIEADSVRIRDGYVVEVGTGLRAGADEVDVDAGGRTLLPGLIDAHTHSWGEAQADALRFGVTTVVDMFTMAAQLPAAREQRERVGPTRQADLFSAGTLATVAGGHGTQYGLPVETVDADDEVLDWVAARQAEGSDFIKIVREDLSAYRGRPELPSLDAGRAQALVEAAHARGLKAVVHVAAYRHAEEALDAGADGLAHVFQDAVANDGFVARAAAHGLFVVPTLTVVAGVAGERTTLVEDVHLGPRLSNGQKQTLGSRFPLPPTPALIANARENVARLHAGGVRILAGTDAPNANTAHGASMHEELAQLVDAGLTPLEALSAATAWPAEAFDLPQRGRIAADMRADLVLVGGQPDRDILDTRRIEAVWKNGHAVDLDRATAVAPALAAGPAGEFDSSHWGVTSDREMGGESTASLQVIDGRLQVSGTIAASAGPGSPAWAGASYFPASEPMAPADASALSGLKLRMRGDPRPYALVMFSGDGGGAPSFLPVPVGRDWTEIEVRWDAVPGLDASQLRVVAITTGQPAGDFEFKVESLEFTP